MSGVKKARHMVSCGVQLSEIKQCPLVAIDEMGLF